MKNKFKLSVEPVFITDTTYNWMGDVAKTNERVYYVVIATEKPCRWLPFKKKYNLFFDREVALIYNSIKDKISRGQNVNVIFYEKNRWFNDELSTGTWFREREWAEDIISLMLTKPNQFILE